MADVLHERAGKVRLLALDSDGVLTDGGVYLFEDGREFRRFDIKDGLGLKRVMALGVEVAIISGSASAPVRQRAQNLGIAEIHLGIDDKLAVLRTLCSERGLKLDQVAYMGDDLPDLPVLEQVGLPCAPADAIDEVISRALFVSQNPGGYGAVRDVCDLLCSALTPDVVH